MAELPKLTLKGGPHGHAVEALLDGEPLHASRIVVDAGVNDAIRIITYQFASVDVDIEGIVAESAVQFKATVRLYPPMPLSGPPAITIPKKIKVTADTPWEALYDAARQLELEAQLVAQGGTIEEPSGRPPGH